MGGTDFLNITPETWTGRVTEDLRQAYKDENTKINVNCQGYNNQQLLVSFKLHEMFHHGKLERFFNVAARNLCIVLFLQGIRDTECRVPGDVTFETVNVMFLFFSYRL